MAEFTHLKMLYIFFFLLFIVNKSLSMTIGIKNEKSCGCYDACLKNFTANSVKDVQKVAACQRGCRFYLLVLHTSHERTPAKDSANAKEGCLFSCSESYKDPFEVAACNFGCSAVEATRLLCSSGEKQIPQISYSLLIEESDVLIHPGEPDPDDVLTDPGLRKQFEKTLEALLDAKSKIPEIHFRNLPIRNEKPKTGYVHVNFKCPKFYGFDSKFEFRNGKIIIGDLYLFVGVFVFVVICFLLGHHIEARSMTKQAVESRISKEDDFDDREPLLKADLNDHCDLIIQKDTPPKYSCLQKEEEFDSMKVRPESKLEDITLVFQDDQGSKEACADNNALKI